MLFVFHMHDLRIDQLLVKSFPRCGMIQPLKGEVETLSKARSIESIVSIIYTGI
jgi:hypothetical protein